MPRTQKSPTDRIEELERKRDQITARIQKTKAVVRTQQRRQDTRRKIIAGALALEHAELDTEFGQVLHKLLNRYVTRPQDRTLFDLPVLPDE